MAITEAVMQELEQRGVKIDYSSNTLSIVFLTEAACLECGKTFMQKRPNNLFCCMRCKNRHGQRIFRERHR